MPLACVVALAALRLILADVMLPDRQGRIIGRPIVGAEQAHTPALQACQQPVQRRPIAVPALPIDQPAGAALECLPDPQLAGLFLTKCQISSSSTTAVLPATGSGLGQ
jgi:hypothetical protein